MLEGLSILKEEELEMIEFTLLGINLKELTDKYNISDSIVKKCSKSILSFGRVSKSEVLKHFESANFSVLLRPSKLRYAKAGFPSKVVESLATGTPIICNISSDLADYLIDGENSLIVKNCTAEEFAITLRKALSLNKEEKQKMFVNARETAKEFFDYRKYENEFNTFLCKQY
jgi:glycosyltransferase involved in cell wall biosynthesis